MRAQRLADRPLVSHADALETIDELGRHLLELLQQQDFQAKAVVDVLCELFPEQTVGSLVAVRTPATAPSVAPAAQVRASCRIPAETSTSTRSTGARKTC